MLAKSTSEDYFVSTLWKLLEKMLHVLVWVVLEDSLPTAHVS